MSKINGVLLKFASITAGYKLADAVPDVVTNTVGSPVILDFPNAKNAPDLSSTWLVQLNF